MFVSSKRPLAVSPQLAFTFPKELCCNCGTREGIEVVMQDTRLTKFFFGGGTEVIFTLPLPFCKRCKASSRRRPTTFIRWVLVFSLFWVFIVFAFTLIGIGTQAVWFMEHSMLMALFLAIIAVIVLISIRRPRPGQTSYSQPLRITKLKRKFVSGEVTGITFWFSNSHYATEFNSLNGPVIASGVVEVA